MFKSMGDILFTDMNTQQYYSHVCPRLSSSQNHLQRSSSSRLEVVLYDYRAYSGQRILLVCLNLDFALRYLASLEAVCARSMLFDWRMHETDINTERRYGNRCSACKLNIEWILRRAIYRHRTLLYGKRLRLRCTRSRVFNVFGCTPADQSQHHASLLEPFQANAE